jgi:hypothetical protein
LLSDFIEVFAKGFENARQIGVTRSPFGNSATFIPQENLVAVGK